MTVPPEWTIADKVYATQDEVHQILTDREAVYKTLVAQSVEERKALWQECRIVEEKMDDYKKVINGKFDKILEKFDKFTWGLIGILLTVMLSFGGIIYNQLAAKHDMNSKVKAFDELRVEHQKISQHNSDELQKIISELKAKK